jgi:hypothetical protein
VAENQEVPDSNIGVPPVRKYANYRTLGCALFSGSMTVMRSFKKSPYLQQLQKRKSEDL